MPAMTRINQTLQPPVHSRYRTVTAAICPTPDHGIKSMLNQALGTIEIREYSPKTDLLTAQTMVLTAILTYLHPSTGLQSP
jgi:hypothetical protein